MSKGQRKNGVRGGALPIVTGILFILVTLVAALHTSQTRAVRKVTQAEAQTQFLQSVEFAKAEILAKPAPLPDWLKVSTSSSLQSERQIEANYADKLWTELPNLNPKDQEFAPGHRTYELKPKTNDAGLNVFRGRFQWLVTHESGGYAAYAPKGKITLGRVMGWANPTFEDKREVDKAFSGVPTVIACQDELELGKLTYGQAYSQNGPIDLGTASSGVGYQGAFPFKAYEVSLESKLDSLVDTFYSAASSGDKTSLISGGGLDTIATIVKMIFGEKGEPNLSLEQAWEFPLPMIPAFSNTIPGTFYEFYFHMPFPPDFSKFDSESPKKGKEQADKVKSIGKERNDLDKKIKAKNSEINKTSSSSKRKKLREEKEKLEEEKKKKDEELGDLKSEIEKRSEEATKEITDKIGSSQPAAPETRAEDKDLPKKTGVLGWSYSPLVTRMFDFLVGIITGTKTMEDIAEVVSAKVRVVHYGDKDTAPDFEFDPHLSGTSTWTVPPGRTFRYRGNMTVKGDVWLQKGSTMAIEGDLELVNPDPSINPLKAAGKLVMEEGSTLVVKGDLTCDGTSRYGSLWVCSRPGRLAPITTAILVTGNAKFPYGSYSATTLEDAVGWLSDEFGGPKEIEQALEVIFTDVAPNLGKIVGPFHTRRPYFAQFAATFQLTQINTPFGPIFIPTPIPLPRKNQLVPIFRALTIVYTPSMNFALGENLYAQSDWWVFGDGAVPAIIKVAPQPLLNSVKTINLSKFKPDIEWDDELLNVSDELIKQALEFAIEKVARAIVKQAIAAAIPFGSIVAEVADQFVDAIDDRGDRLDALKTRLLEETLDPILRPLKKWADDLKELIEDHLEEAYLREVTGPLIYAESVTVGDGNRPRLMAGMIVAKNNIDISARVFVGSLTSLKGDITAETFYYTPSFTRASLYKPKATKTNFVERGLEFKYGKNFDSKSSVDVDTTVWQVTTESWNE